MISKMIEHDCGMQLEVKLCCGGLNLAKSVRRSVGDMPAELVRLASVLMRMRRERKNTRTMGDDCAWNWS